MGREARKDSPLTRRRPIGGPSVRPYEPKVIPTPTPLKGHPLGGPRCGQRAATASRAALGRREGAGTAKAPRAPTRVDATLKQGRHAARPTALIQVACPAPIKAIHVGRPGARPLGEGVGPAPVPSKAGRGAWRIIVTQRVGDTASVPEGVAPADGRDSSRTATRPRRAYEALEVGPP